MRKKFAKNRKYLNYLSTVFFMVVISTLLLYKADIKYEIRGYIDQDETRYSLQYERLKKDEKDRGPELIEEEIVVEIDETESPPSEEVHEAEIKKIEDVYVTSALLIGDSMLQVGVGNTLENYFKTENVNPVTRVAVQSTGLLHPERLDWFSKVDELMGNQHYDIVFIMWGLNDDDHITSPEGKWVGFNTPEWEEEYARLIRAMMEKITIQHNGKVLVWIGLPIVKDEKWDWKVRLFNKLYEREAQNYHNVIYIDSYTLFTKDGAYTSTLTNKAGETKVARHTDHLHLNSFGGAILADHIIDKLVDTQVRFGPEPPQDQ